MDAIRVIAENRKARHEYYIEDVIEAGIVLQGTEVKSVRGRRVNLRTAMPRWKTTRSFGMHISPYEQGNRFNHDPLRVRKLLLNRSEIRRLIGITREKGHGINPLRLSSPGTGKGELAVAREKTL